VEACLDQSSHRSLFAAASIALCSSLASCAPSCPATVGVVPSRFVAGGGGALAVVLAGAGPCTACCPALLPVALGLAAANAKLSAAAAGAVCSVGPAGGGPADGAADILWACGSLVGVNMPLLYQVGSLPTISSDSDAMLLVIQCH